MPYIRKNTKGYFNPKTKESLSEAQVYELIKQGYQVIWTHWNNKSNITDKTIDLIESRMNKIKNLEKKIEENQKKISDPWLIPPPPI